MDYHMIGNNNTDNFFWTIRNPKYVSPEKYPEEEKEAIRREERRLQDIYDERVSLLMKSSKPKNAPSAILYDHRNRTIKAFFSEVDDFVLIIINGRRVRWKEGDKTRTRLLLTPLLTARGRYLKTDMVLFLAMISRERHNRSLSSCCDTFAMNLSTCRGWAKNLLLCEEHHASADESIWDQCERMLSTIHSEKDAIGFLDSHTWLSGIFRNDIIP